MSARDVAISRAGGFCERCGVWVVGRLGSVHHRRPRGMGGGRGLDTVENLVVLCGSGTTGCHGWVESFRAEAIADGWLVPRRSAAGPEDVPVWVDGHWFAVGKELEHVCCWVEQ